MEVRKVAKNERVFKNTWAEYRNLTFFNGLQPTNFYFDLLLNEWEGHEAFTSFANQIGSQAQERIAQAVNSLKSAPEESGYKDKLQIICPLLDRAIKKEQANEIAFFKQKYQNFISNFSPEQIKATPYLNQIANFFKECNPNQPIDYPKFIAIVNILLSGLDNAKFSLDYEEKRLQDLEERLQIITSNVGRRAVGLAKITGKDQQQYKLASGKKLRTRLRNQFLLHGNYKDKNGEYIRDLKGILNGLKGTIDVEVSNWINEHLQEALNNDEIRQQIIARIVNDERTFTDQRALERDIANFLVMRLVRYGLNNISSILSDNVAKKATDEILREVQTIIEEPSLDTEINVEGVYSNIFQYGTHLDFFDKDESNSAKGLFDAINKLYKDINNHYRKARMSQQRKIVASVFGQDEALKDMRTIINNIESQIKQIEKAIERGDKEYKLILNRANQSEKKNLKENNFILKIENGKITNLHQLSAILNEYSLASGFKGEKLRIDSLTGIIANLKTRFSKKVEKKLEELIKNGINLNNKKSIGSGRVKEVLQKGLENIQVQVSGPKLSELAQFLTLEPQGDTVKLVWTGPHNGKNDTVEITITTPTMEIKKELTNIFSTNLDNLNSDIMQVYTQAQKEMAETMGMELVNSINNLVDNHQYHQYDTIANDALKREADILSLNEDSVEMLQKMPRVQELLNLMRANNSGLSEEELRQKEKQLLKSLLDFFFVSSTVKTYNNYTNEYGFLGGSLGADVAEQLETLNKFFTAAGAPIAQDDMKWLIGAIINCSSHSVVDTQYKQTIEDYLGSIAVFSLFDEGMLESLAITNIKERIEQPITSTSMKIMHLYRLNGGYYTGSYVLSRARSYLGKYIDTIISLPETIPQRAGVVILGGGVTPNDLPNKGLSEPTEFDPWGKISKTAQGRAKIQVLFMAGLLQTLSKINLEINNIELPN